MLKNPPHWPLFLIAIGIGISACVGFIGYANSGVCVAEKESEIEVLVQQRSNKKQEDAKTENSASNSKPKDSIYKISAIKMSNSGINQPAGEGNKNHEAEKPSKWIIKFLCDVKATDLAISLFTYFLFIVGWFQSAYLRKQLKATEIASAVANDSAKAVTSQLRSYVGVMNSSIEELVAGLAPKVNVTLRNSGQTPAYKLRGFLSFGWSDSFERFGKDPVPKGSLFGTLGTGGTFLMHGQSPKFLTEEEFSRLQNGKLTFYVWGEVFYSDVFDKEHFLKYRLQTGGPNGIHGEMLASSPEGNNAD